MKTPTYKHFAGLATASAIAFAPVAALAHGKLENAAPASGSTVDVAPDALRLTFNEDLEPTFSSVKVSDASGNAVTKEKAKVDASNPRVMTLGVPKLTSGTYTVLWAVMTADSHKTKGTYTFKVK
ncbi:TPA: copper homeostasis periplasmic binding protein CopC [Burkholderia contaminans]|uniref:copper homeostasis periplasmic binding protein CopC n=1 Tax=Burkholderia cepacia complex TaxID=87882 RepID=UPI00075D2A35|nr:MULTISPECIES: copper homeostasis periplasmic binding protein CopC [Burkholderia cepacia complex]KVS22059.1 copper resistance protein CopC [Burkholderia vietnamiensis]MBM6430573.1 copper homeostasis periplasmic binding protein CopC [Burkholderia contaminans]MCA7880844.1 copper homeostasis periplasmic binding protein CopC [Burkholderia contaminans]MCB4349252.1 copper homeostasis periplasmic binding protein CopC [Burkholderia vietnamiensis]MDN8025832.1 copper homeostasis periplasmic binding pr